MWLGCKELTITFQPRLGFPSFLSSFRSITLTPLPQGGCREATGMARGMHFALQLALAARDQKRHSVDFDSCLVSWSLGSRKRERSVVLASS